MANIVNYNPFEDFFKGFNSGLWAQPFTFPGAPELSIKIDVREDEQGYTIKADIPGVKKEDIQIDIDDNQVSLSAETRQEKEEKKGEKTVFSERSYGMVNRSFTLPCAVDEKGAKAEYRDGVLNLTLPKRSNGSTKRIAVS